MGCLAPFIHIWPQLINIILFLFSHFVYLLLVMFVFVFVLLLLWFVLLSYLVSGSACRVYWCSKIWMNREILWPKHTQGTKAHLCVVPLYCRCDVFVAQRTNTIYGHNFGNDATLLRVPPLEVLFQCCGAL